MLHRHLVIPILSLSSLLMTLIPGTALAETTLNKAIIENLQNQVRLIPQNQSARAAKVQDQISVGDSLATAASSRADIRFNDKSLARLGEQAIFRFIPGTRSVDLANGTLLLLIPPGQGNTRVRTPNAVAGIRGSALVLRYDPVTNTTSVAALTSSNITILNQDGSQSVMLKGGQMAVLVNQQIEHIYEFDLNTFYNTSPLVQDLNLTETSTSPNPEGIDAVKAEISQALAEQTPIQGENTIVNPSFIRLSSQTASNVDQASLASIWGQIDQLQATEDILDTDFVALQDNLKLRGIIDTGEVIATDIFLNGNNGGLDGITTILGDSGLDSSALLQDLENSGINVEDFSSTLIDSLEAAGISADDLKNNQGIGQELSNIIKQAKDQGTDVNVSDVVNQLQESIQGKDPNKPNKN